MEKIFMRTVEVGGTITGEHGVGLAKKPYLRGQFRDHSYELLKQVKRTIRDAGYGIRDTGYEIRESGCGKGRWNMGIYFKLLIFSGTGVWG